MSGGRKGGAYLCDCEAVFDEAEKVWREGGDGVVEAPESNRPRVSPALVGPALAQSLAKDAGL